MVNPLIFLSLLDKIEINNIKKLAKLYIAKYLMEHTDEHHAVSTPQLIEHLNKEVGHLMGQKHLEIHLDLDDVYVEADSEKIMTVVTNLYSNAIRYTPDGAHIYVTLKRHEDKVRFEIENTGISSPKVL